MNEIQQKWMEEKIPDLYNGAYRKQYKEAVTTKSLRAAINAKCLDCTCWQRAEIRDCLVPACPLFPHRPYRPDTPRTA